MVKHNKKRPFVIVYLDLVENGLTYEEAALIRYVKRFEESNKPCFASIPYIAKDLRLAERTIRRHLRRLIDLEYLRATGKGRGRYLNTNAAKMATNTGQNVTECGQNGRCDTGQNGRLSNSIMINSSINNNLSINNISKLDITGGSMKGETEAERKRRLHLKGLWDDPTGWTDDGSALTKWDETYQTLLRKPKPVHALKAWNGKADYSDIPE
jgi:hypothetical protein